MIDESAFNLSQGGAFMSEETELLRLILREPETGLDEAKRRYAPFV